MGEKWSLCSHAKCAFEDSESIFALRITFELRPLPVRAVAPAANCWARADEALPKVLVMMHPAFRYVTLHSCRDHRLIPMLPSKGTQGAYRLPG